MTILNGKEIAAEVLAGCREKVQALQAGGVTPGLAVVIVGDDPASHVFVNSKVRTCGELGIYSRRIELPGETTQEEVELQVSQEERDKHWEQTEQCPTRYHI